MGICLIIKTKRKKKSQDQWHLHSIFHLKWKSKRKLFCVWTKQKKKHRRKAYRRDAVDSAWYCGDLVWGGCNNGNGNWNIHSNNVIFKVQTEKKSIVHFARCYTTSQGSIPVVKSVLFFSFICSFAKRRSFPGVSILLFYFPSVHLSKLFLLLK